MANQNYATLTDQDVSVRIGGPRGVILARVSGGFGANNFPNRCYIFQVIPNTANEVQLLKYNFGSYTTLFQGTINGVDTADFRMRLAVVNGHLDGFVNTTQMFSVVDTSYLQGTFGLMAYSSETWYDDVLVNPAASCATPTDTPQATATPVCNGNCPSQYCGTFENIDLSGVPDTHQQLLNEGWSFSGSGSATVEYDIDFGSKALFIRPSSGTFFAMANENNLYALMDIQDIRVRSGSPRGVIIGRASGGFGASNFPNRGYVFQVIPNVANEVTLLKLNFGTSVQLGQTTINSVNAEDYSMRLVIVNGHIDAYVNSTQVFSIDDASYATGTFGLMAYNAETKYDDLLVNPALLCPSATPTKSPSHTISPTPSPSPTVTATPSPSSSATATATVTPTGTMGPSFWLLADVHHWGSPVGVPMGFTEGASLPPFEGLVRGIALSPNFAGDQTLFVITDEPGGLYVSKDQGATWYLHGNSGSFPATDDMLALAMAPEGTMFLSSYDSTTALGHIWKSQDGGITWTIFDSGPSSPFYATGFAVSPNYASDKVLYAIATLVPFYPISKWDGSQWVATGFVSGTGFGHMTPLSLLCAPDYNDASHPYVLTGGIKTIFRTVNGGATWQSDIAGIPTPVNQLPNGHVFVGLAAEAPSPSLGASYQTFAGGNTLDTGNDITVGSVDFGGTPWTDRPIAPGLDASTHSFALSPNFASDRLVYAGLVGNQGGLVRSTDGGVTWIRDEAGFSPAALSVEHLAISPNFAADGVVFAGTAAGLYVDPRGAKRSSFTSHPLAHKRPWVDEFVYFKNLTVSTDTLSEGGDHKVDFNFDLNRVPGAFHLSILAPDGSEYFGKKIMGISSHAHKISWNGRDERGRNAPDGDYIAVLTAYGAPWHRYEIRVAIHVGAGGVNPPPTATLTITPSETPGALMASSAKAVDAGKSELPGNKTLLAGPNPARQSFTAFFKMDLSAKVRFLVMSLSGNTVKSAVPGELGPGIHHLPIDCADLATGYYVLALQVDDGNGYKTGATFKMAVVH